MRSIRSIINSARKRRGKKNGVVRWLYEDYLLERKTATNKNNYKRNNKVALT